MVIIPLVVTVGIAAGLTFLLVPLVIHLCKTYGWLAHPNARSVHRVAIPMLGGIAIIAGIGIALLSTLFFESLNPLFHRSPYEQLRLGLLLTGGGIIATVSLIDDIRALSPTVRLPIHFAAALIAVGPYLWDSTLYPNMYGVPTEARGIILTAFNVPVFQQIHLHALSPWLAILVTMVWITGIQNMLNWLDGLDGLATGITLIASLVLALHAIRLGQWTVALLPLALVGACLGFLPFNMHPAHIFMGDVGAMTLGYLLAVSAIIGGAKLATALLVLGIPLIDMTWLILTRLRQGRSVAAAGRDNLHIRLLDMGFTQRQIVWAYYALSAAFGTIALLDVAPMLKLLALLVLGTMVAAMLLYVARWQR